MRRKTCLQLKSTRYMSSWMCSIVWQRKIGRERKRISRRVETHTHTILVEDSVHVFFLPLRERWDLFMECMKNRYSRNNEKRRKKKGHALLKKAVPTKKMYNMVSNITPIEEHALFMFNTERKSCWQLHTCIYIHTHIYIYIYIYMSMYRREKGRNTRLNGNCSFVSSPFLLA